MVVIRLASEFRAVRFRGVAVQRSGRRVEEDRTQPPDGGRRLGFRPGRVHVLAGSVEFSGDIDYFELKTGEGEFYLVETALGTLEDSWLELLDRQGMVASNDDHETSPAARLSWLAPGNGPYWIVVGGYGTGAYELTAEEVQASQD